MRKAALVEFYVWFMCGAMGKREDTRLGTRSQIKWLCTATDRFATQG